MKRILALVIAALLLTSIGMSALAANPSPKKDNAFTFEKNYTSTDGKTWPEETLEFEVEAKSNNPDGGTAKIVVGDNGKFEVKALKNNVPVSYPAFPKAGVYRFTIKEKAGDTQGVEYNTDGNEITVSILVVFDKDGNLVVEEAGCDRPSEDAEKNDKFENKYTFGGDDGESGLKVSKAIKGNLADPNKLFTMKVKFESDKPVRSTIEYEGGSDASAKGTIPHEWEGTKEVTIKIKDGETVTFKKIPVGVKYTVEEDSSHLAKGEKPTQDELNSEEGYLATYEDEEGTIEAKKTHEAKVTNTKETEIYTGITLETLPYILILAVVVIGGAFAIIRRRKSKDE